MSLPQGLQARPGGLGIVGPTASGKSALAMALARRHPAVELVSMDSMCVYRGMDIGTSKPRPSERAQVAHHLLDVVSPCEEFSVSQFKQLADEAIRSILRRGGMPVLVGGTALYVRAVVDDLDIPGRWPEEASRLEAEAEADGGSEALHARLLRLDPVAARRIEPANRRRVVRALEVTIGSGRPFSSFGPGLRSHPPTPFRLVGLDVPYEELDRRIQQRLVTQMSDGWLEEARSLSRMDLSPTARQALGYRELFSYLEGEIGLDEAISTVLRRTRRMARRQMAWLRRDPRVRWVRGGSGDGSDDWDNALAVCDEVLGDFSECLS